MNMSATTTGLFDGIEESFNEDPIAKDLLRLFQSPAFLCGQSLINHFKQINGVNATLLTHDQITIADIKEFLMRDEGYVSLAADRTSFISPAKLKRSLQKIKLFELARMIDPAHQNLIVKAIRNARSAKGALDNDTVFIQSMDPFKYLDKLSGEFTLSDEEVDTLYNKIERSLNSVKNERNATIKGLAVVLGGEKPVQVQDDIKDFFEFATARMTAPLTGAYEREAAKLHENAVRENPELKLQPSDFLGKSTAYKDLLMDKLEVLRERESDKSKLKSAAYGKFNAAIRKILRADYPTAADKAKLDAKLKFALSKLAIVLRQNGKSEDADKILFTLGAELTYEKTPELFGNAINEQDAKIMAKLDATFKRLKRFTDGLLARGDALPADVKVEILKNRGQVQDHLDNYVGAAANIQDYPQARRKYADRCIKILRDIDVLYIDSYGRNGLVGIPDAQVAEIEAIAPRKSLLTIFENNYKKLKSRTDLDNSSNESYLNMAAIKKKREDQVTETAKQTMARKKQLEGTKKKLELLVTNNDVEKLILTEQLNLPAQQANYQARITISQRIIVINSESCAVPDLITKIAQIIAAPARLADAAEFEEVMQDCKPFIKSEAAPEHARRAAHQPGME